MGANIPSIHVGFYSLWALPESGFFPITGVKFLRMTLAPHLQRTHLHDRRCADIV
jgi:hypothetical protein